MSLIFRVGLKGTDRQILLLPEHMSCLFLNCKFYEVNHFNFVDFVLLYVNV